MLDKPPFGLSEEQLDRIRNTIASSPRVVRAFIFGSRAMGTYRNGSDIDIALEGEDLTFDDILRLHSSIDALNLPYFVDIVDVKRIENPDLKDHISRVGMLIYQRLSVFTVD